MILCHFCAWVRVSAQSRSATIESNISLSRALLPKACFVSWLLIQLDRRVAWWCSVSIYDTDQMTLQALRKHRLAVALWYVRWSKLHFDRVLLLYSNNQLHAVSLLKHCHALVGSQLLLISQPNFTDLAPTIAPLLLPQHVDKRRVCAGDLCFLSVLVTSATLCGVPSSPEAHV